MKLIVGLGNPGTEYERTRHNLGFMVVDRFFKNYETVKNTVWDNSAKFKSDICQIEWQPKQGKFERVIIAKPKTYMNNSGMAVRLISDFYKIKPEDIWIIHDDVDLPIGSMKIRFGGASAGHHGVDSIIEGLNTDKFWRFRMGIGVKSSKKMEVDFDGEEHEKVKIKSVKLRGVDDYVLGNFVGGEKGKLKLIIQKGAKAIEASLEYSLDRAMNSFNTK